MRKAEFDHSNFKDCTFADVDFVACGVHDCEFMNTKFKNSRLDLIYIMESVKLSDLNQSIEIKDEDLFEKILKDMNLLISTDENEIDQ